jgi:sugar (pentulose or hexulose) kinase
VAALQRIVAIGGTTRNRLLMHIKAAVMQHTIEAISLQEAACLGVALLAGVGAGLYADHAAAHASIRRDWQAFAPDASLIPVYESRFQQVYRRMYPALKPLHDQLLVAQG